MRSLRSPHPYISTTKELKRLQVRSQDFCLLPDAANLAGFEEFYLLVESLSTGKLLHSTPSDATQPAEINWVRKVISEIGIDLSPPEGDEGNDGGEEEEEEEELRNATARVLFAVGVAATSFYASVCGLLRLHVVCVSAWSLGCVHTYAVCVGRAVFACLLAGACACIMPAAEDARYPRALT